MKRDSLKQLLVTMRDEVGSVGRLAQRLETTDRCVRDWLARDEALDRIKPDNLRRIQELAVSLGLDWTACIEPPVLWNINDGFGLNLRSVPVPPPGIGPLQSLQIPFLGKRLLSPFGPSASVLTANSNFINFHANTGSGVITYKTVRSSARDGHAWPQIFFCSPDTPVLGPDFDDVTVIVGTEDGDSFRASDGMMNRFGIPSSDWERVTAEFARAKALVKPNQLLILSVVGSALSTDKSGVLVDDFVRIATAAFELGAEAVELNLSCPNCDGKEGLVYQDRALTVRICKAVRSAIPKAKLLAKIGYCQRDFLAALVAATAEFVDGYTAINTVPVKGYRRKGDNEKMSPAWSGAEKAGLSGPPIRRLALSVVGSLAECRARENGTFEIIGVGGVQTAQDAIDFLSTGANVVQATNVFFVNSLFALHVHAHLSKHRPADDLAYAGRLNMAMSNWNEAVHEMGTALRNGPGMAAAGEAFAKWRGSFEYTFYSGGPRRSTDVPSVSDFMSRIEVELSRFSQQKSERAS